MNPSVEGAEGIRLLREAIGKFGTAKAFAAHVSVNPTTLSSYATGKLSPPSDVRAKFRELASIPEEAWGAKSRARPTFRRPKPEPIHRREEGATLSEGQKALRAIVAERTLKEVAYAVGISAGDLRSFMADIVPNRLFRVFLSDLGISVRAWDAYVDSPCAR